MSDYIIRELMHQFKEKGGFSRKELFDFYLKFDPDLKEGTFGWRIYDLKEKGLIKQVKRGVYNITDKPEYQPKISNELHRITAVAYTEFDDLQYCAWNIEWLNEFTQHQFSINFNILEVEKELTKPILFALKENGFKNTFLMPDKYIIERNVADYEKAVVITNFISRSPVQNVHYKNRDVITPTLEKILVDVFSDSETFYFLYGIEKNYIFESAIKSYTIDFTKLLSYASRRGKRDELKVFLLEELELEKAIKDVIK